MTSLPVWTNSGDDTKVILGASNLKRLSCHSFHLIPNMFTVTDTHYASLGLQYIKDGLKSSPYTISVLPLFDEDIDSLIAECKQILNVAYRLCNKFNQRVQRNLYERNYDHLIKIVDKLIKQYPIWKVAQKAITLINKVFLHCERKIRNVMIIIMNKCR